jgi:glycine/D-amino acid oxidase-like deaminating enzyme
VRNVRAFGGYNSVEHDDDGVLQGELSSMALNVSDAIATIPFLDKCRFEKVDHSRRESWSLDALPVIGSLLALPNVAFAFGWSGHGFGMSLGLAKYLADWLDTGVAPPELAPFSPSRFQGQPLPCFSDARPPGFDERNSAFAANEAGRGAQSQRQPR